MNANSHISPSANIRCRLRSAMALVLMTVFAFGQWVLSPTALSGLANFAGEHEVIVQGDTVILHHQQNQQRTHHGFTKVLTAFSQTNNVGDHVLSSVEVGLYEEPRTAEVAEIAPTLEIGEDSVDEFIHHGPPSFVICEQIMATAPWDENGRGLTLAHWRTVKIMV